MPGRVLLDTSVLVALLRGDSAAAGKLGEAEDVYTNVVALGELCAKGRQDRFAEAYFGGTEVTERTEGTENGGQAALYRILDPVKQRFTDHLDKAQQEAVRSDLNEFVRLYAFLSQIVTFSDPELERLYIFPLFEGSGGGGRRMRGRSRRD